MLKPATCGTTLRRKQEGLVAVTLLFLIATGFLLTTFHILYEPDKRARQQEVRSASALQSAKHELLAYLVFRADNPLVIAQGTVAFVEPRWLMLPCPDNVGGASGDHRLDGSQDPHCGADNRATSNVVNDILDSGSRFGRWPWRSRSHRANSINDGVGEDTHDVYGNRLWYALSQNMAPTKNNDNIPLNLHRLATQANRWLSVVNHQGYTVSDKVAAVILAPGRALLERQSEQTLTQNTYQHPSDVTQPSSALFPAAYFESYYVSVLAKTYSNADKDSIFIEAPVDQAGGFNDTITYIDIDELIDPQGFFFNAYKTLSGVTDVHNQPQDNYRLARVHEAFSTYYSLFGFYPIPANQALSSNVNSRQRYCSAYHSGQATVDGVFANGLTGLLPADITVRTMPTGLADMTLTLATESAVLLHNHAVISLLIKATVITHDDTIYVDLLTLARYTRLTLTATVLVASADTDLQPISADSYRITAGATLTLLSEIRLRLPAQTPLQPQGHLSGWLPEYDKTPQRAGDDGAEFFPSGEVRGTFLSPVVLTTAMTSLTLMAPDILILTTGSTIQLEKDLAQLDALSGLVHTAEGDTITITAMLPTAASYSQRQFILWLLVDAPQVNRTVYAPAVLFPWRDGVASKRDNWHTYPPCFDADYFYNHNFLSFLQDQPIFYAVAEACHYGGDSAVCGQSAGLTVQVAAGASVALPQALTLTHSFNARLNVGGRTVTVTLRNGVVRNTTDIILTHSTRLPIPSGGDIVAEFRLPVGYVFSSGERVVIPAGSTLIGGSDSHLVNVPALLIYSVAPLPRVACSTAMTDTFYHTGQNLLLANQLAEATDITAPCYWLDDEENIDNDGHYIIYPPSHDGDVSLRNDFFLLFGGQLQI